MVRLPQRCAILAFRCGVGFTIALVPPAPELDQPEDEVVRLPQRCVKTVVGGGVGVTVLVQQCRLQMERWVGWWQGSGPVG